ncbi:FAD-dependent monooxygenase [Archangium lipolyticum]|uniref:FAD-dependent monooxygenase n=1 Tax=Archangium lipolyticum TaxID=2970465 RepID=UPI00214A5E08|nr:FAD-dependent monooxygenase [Archangium lipolyticum]
MEMLDALVVGAGPTGLTMAAELARHGLRCRIVDSLEAPSRLSRALVVQSRTVELFDDFDMAGKLLERGEAMGGYNVIGAGGRRARIPMRPFPWLETRYPIPHMVPQDATEAVLTEHLASFGLSVEWAVTFEGFREDAGGMELTLKHQDGTEESVRARWLLGCDGARSRVRKAADIPFEGETYDYTCILADVRVDWPLGPGELFIIPSRHGVVAAFPMPGENRYRLVLNMPRDGKDETEPPTLEQIQALVERMIPVPTRLSDPLWMTRYRQHRLGVPYYRKGRVFLAGDAAHIHSPAGGQGLNTGIQDAYNLAWKLALVTRGRAPESLLDTYDLERHRVGQKLLEGTDRRFALISSGGLVVRMLRAHVMPRAARWLFKTSFMERKLLRFVSELFIHYRHSPLSTESISGEDAGGVRISDGPAPGERVPDLPLLGAGVERLHEVLRGPHHTLLLFAGLVPAGKTPAALESLARQLEASYGPELLRVRVVATGARSGPYTLADATGAVHRRFGAGAACLYLVRPDGYVGHRARPIQVKSLATELAARMGPPRQAPASVELQVAG